MSDLFDLAPGQRAVAAPLFARFGELPAVLGAVFDHGLGSIAVDDADAPRVARLLIGIYSLFAGDPTSAAAAELVRSVTGPREMVYGSLPAWRRLIVGVHGPALQDHPNATFDPSTLDLGALRFAARTLPAEFEMVRLDLRLAGQLNRDLEPHALQVYPDAASLIADGFAFGALRDGRLACVASSYAVGRGSAEVAISTAAEFRGRGLAFAVAARFLQHSLESGLVPEWNSSNPISQRLAVRLGYRRKGSLEDLLLR